MECQRPTSTCRRTENISFSTKHRYHAHLWDALHGEKLSPTPLLYSLSLQPSSWDCWRRSTIIKCSIKHRQRKNHSEYFLQATSVSVEDYTSPLTVSAVYLPPKPTVKHDQLIPSGINSSQEETSTPSILPGDSDLFHLVDMKSWKRWNN
jgi:hypothetical protein